MPIQLYFGISIQISQASKITKINRLGLLHAQQLNHVSCVGILISQLGVEHPL